MELKFLKKKLECVFGQIVFSFQRSLSPTERQKKSKDKKTVLFYISCYVGVPVNQQKLDSF